MSEYKKFALILFIILTACGSNTYTQESLIDELCFHWTLTEVELDGQRANASVLGSTNTLEFDRNGKYEINENESITSGVWKFDEEKQRLITMDKEGTIEHEIISLDEKTMISRIFENNNEYKFYYTKTSLIEN